LSVFAKINEDLSKVFKRILGTGPKSIKTCIVDDIVVVKFDWYDEEIIEVIESYDENISSVKNVIEDLFIISREEFKRVIENHLNIKVKKMYFDITHIEIDLEKIAVFLMEEKVMID